MLLRPQAAYVTYDMCLATLADIHHVPDIQLTAVQALQLATASGYHGDMLSRARAHMALVITFSASRFVT